jgi:hypothetical protein
MRLYSIASIVNMKMLEIILYLAILVRLLMPITAGCEVLLGTSHSLGAYRGAGDVLFVTRP